MHTNTRMIYHSDAILCVTYLHALRNDEKTRLLKQRVKQGSWHMARTKTKFKSLRNAS